MNYIIENEFLKVEISSLGAELMSILKKDDMSEYLWQGDKTYWGGRAPNMFPICGRLYEGKYTYLGKEYSMPNHGIARSSEFTLTMAKSDSITLTLTSNEDTYEKYPFNFKYDITFTLSKNQLTVSYKVVNKDEKDLIFAIGAHPAFNVPFDKDCAFSDCYVEFSSPCDAIRVDFSPSCYCTNKDKPFQSHKVQRIDLDHSLFDNDAIFLYNVSKEIKLASYKSSRSITVKYDGMKYLGLWHAPKTDAPYICIEPWTSIPATEGVTDNLLTKKEMVHLPKDYIYKNQYSITIC